ncbi:MAG: hypothetical protein A2W93_06740 [Bacteroidetes bacterium GWF2_43_63]|nr:MAG: hypothetical protein A2W94_07795 [Bacteroidetes bacterium GWE2_42_42]OFY53316.1 MAG: hypothetical protein A2W93_06740 [Bacteroidetes bacterium GWF2_43_63]HBG71689.1 glycosyl transferase [Bacteroidales bacterium]HCB61646.1 glycosyl transferase [Bacteroidales bacterium]HCY22858.1 glycosyl transferase [Bacteroidales bacterium]
MKILVYRISSIGDIILTTPVVRCLKKQHPDAEIHYITRKRYAETMSSNPYISKLWLVKKSPLEILDELKAEKFDYMIDLHRNWRSQRLMAHLNTKYYTFNKLNIRKWIFTKLKINLLPDIHIVDRYFRAVRKLQVVNDEEGLDFFFPKDYNPEITKNLPDKYIALAIGGTYATKRYPAEQIIEFVKSMSLPVILLGGKSENETAGLIEKSCSEKIINLCDKLSLTESAAVIGKSKIVISNDTGMMHIAAALHKPLISIWGNTVPAFGMYPYFPEGLENRSEIVENKNLRCRPCSKLGYKKCPKEHFRCMKDISPMLVAEKARKFIGV